MVFKRNSRLSAEAIGIGYGIAIGVQGTSITRLIACSIKYIIRLGYTLGISGGEG